MRDMYSKISKGITIGGGEDVWKIDKLSVYEEKVSSKNNVEDQFRRVSRLSSLKLVYDARDLLIRLV